MMYGKRRDYDPNTGQTTPFNPDMSRKAPGAGKGTPQPARKPRPAGPTMPSARPTAARLARPNTRPMPNVKTPEPEVTTQPVRERSSSATPPAYMVEMYRRMMQRRGGQ